MANILIFYLLKMSKQGIRILQRNRILDICTYRDLLQGVHSCYYGGWEVQKICCVGWQAADPGEPMVQMT